MSDQIFISGCRIFDGSDFLDGKGLLLEDSKVTGVFDTAKKPADARQIVITEDHLIVPGFVDLQVNGGGGVMLNDNQSVEAIETICAAHARFGTTALLPTLITDTKETTHRALIAGTEAARQNVPGFLGLHMEGPHLSVARKGAHDPALIRSMDDDDLETLTRAKGSMSVLMTTIAPENVSAEQVRRLAENGIKVSIGHTNASFDTAVQYAGSGASLVTHLFNAMSQLGNREPGLVGAALQLPSLSAGLITDGFHVDPVSIAVAIRAKNERGRIFIVTDAMCTIGTEMTEFQLNGRRILREKGKLTLEDGTLAGADIDMMASVRYLHQVVGIELKECLRMGSFYPAEAIGQSSSLGQLLAGYDASFAVLDKNLNVTETWIRGRQVFSV